ncbi:MAG: hypothetical protein ACOVP4_13235 [Bacteriovoracaceae bacterium]
MKTILTVALATLSLSSFAGTLGHPDQDPVVSYTRQLFDNGEEPKAGFLLNNTFECTVMSAVKGDFKKEDQGEVKFRRAGKLFTSDDLSDELFFAPNVDGDELVATSMVEDENGESSPNYAALRMNTDENVLVLEASKLLKVDELSEVEKESVETKFSKPLATVGEDDSEVELVVVTSYALCSIVE